MPTFVRFTGSPIPGLQKHPREFDGLANLAISPVSPPHQHCDAAGFELSTASRAVAHTPFQSLANLGYQHNQFHDSYRRAKSLSPGFQPSRQLLL